jgi:hypothetical protein
MWSYYKTVHNSYLGGKTVRTCQNVIKFSEHKIIKCYFFLVIFLISLDVNCYSILGFGSIVYHSLGISLI